MLKICKKHKTAPALIYGQCVGCELEGLRKKVEDLEGTLKVIHTWASFDLSEGQQTALKADDTIKLCNKALGRK